MFVSLWMDHACYDILIKSTGKQASAAQLLYRHVLVLLGLGILKPLKIHPGEKVKVVLES